MLPSVLLHVIEAPRPVNASFDTANIDGTVDHVNDRVVLLPHVQNICVAQFAQIIRLAAGGGIEQCLIQNRGPARRKSRIFGFRDQLATQNLRGKILLERIIVIKPAGCHIRSSLAHDVFGILPQCSVAALPSREFYRAIFCACIFITCLRRNRLRNVNTS